MRTKSKFKASANDPIFGAKRLCHLLLGLCAEEIGEEARRKLVISLTAYLAVAIRGLVPGPLVGDHKQKMFLPELAKALIETESAQAENFKSKTPESIKSDETAFTALTEPFKLTESPLARETLEKLAALWSTNKIKAQDKAAIKDSLRSPLIVSTVWEVLSIKGSKTALSQTQFFTPDWVAKIIAQSISYNQGARTVDPACGAGNLLLAVLDRWLELNGDLAQIFKDGLYGYDIDVRLLQICGLTLYLRAREITEAELPLPNLVLSCPPAGSLLLGVEEKEDAIKRILFDNVIMNPPYQSTRTMDGATNAYLKKYYPSCQGDLYTAFLDLALRILKPGGTLCTITQQSFFSIQRYRQFRLDLLDQVRFEKIIALGTGVFRACPGDKVNNTIITVQKNTPVEGQTLTYLKNDSPHRISQTKLRANTLSIPGNPYIFDAPDALVRLFIDHPPLKDFAPHINIVNGLFTCNNKLFVKDKSQVDASEEALYVPYDKGGGRKWYFETPLRLRWEDNGDRIRDYRASRGQTRTLPGADYYFKSGVTYSYIGTSGFRARLLSPQSIFDIASSAVFSESLSQYYLLSFLNSSTVIYLLSTLNPTINFQIGDLRRLPFKEPDSALVAALDGLAREAVDMVRENNPLSQADREKEADLQKEIDELIFKHYEIDSELRREIENNSWVKNARAKAL